MQTYDNFSPTVLDAKGLMLPDRQSWLVAPVNRNRDSGAFSDSNFETFLKEVGEEGDDVEVHRFSHWGPGWFEIILIRPDTPAAEAALKAESRLENYPILDENDLSFREQDIYTENWASWGCREFVQEICRKYELTEEDEEIFENAGSERLLSFFEELNPSGDVHDDGVPNIRRSVEKSNEGQIEEFLQNIATHGAKLG